MATFGKTTNGTLFTQSSADRKRVSAAVPASSGTATKITLRTWVESGSTVAKGVIYSDNAGAPNALLAVSDEVTISNTSEAEVDFPLSGANQISIVSGTTYHIGFHHQDPGAANIDISRDSTASGNTSQAETYSDGPSDPWGSVATATGVIDCYVTYTEAGGTTFDSWGYGGGYF